MGKPTLRHLTGWEPWMAGASHWIFELVGTLDNILGMGKTPQGIYLSEVLIRTALSPVVGEFGPPLTRCFGFPVHQTEDTAHVVDSDGVRHDFMAP
mgnify:CR=1 FL=1